MHRIVVLLRTLFQVVKMTKLLPLSVPVNEPCGFCFCSILLSNLKQFYSRCRPDLVHDVLQITIIMIHNVRHRRVVAYRWVLRSRRQRSANEGAASAVDVGVAASGEWHELFLPVPVALL